MNINNNNKKTSVLDAALPSNAPFEGSHMENNKTFMVCNKNISHRLNNSR